MKPDHEQRRKTRGDGQHMQPAIYRMVVRVVVMRIQAHGSAASRAATSVAEGTVRSLMQAVILSEGGLPGVLSSPGNPSRRILVSFPRQVSGDAGKLRRRLQQKL